MRPGRGVVREWRQVHLAPMCASDTYELLKILHPLSELGVMADVTRGVACLERTPLASHEFLH